jgi:cytochrome P450
VVLVLVVAKSSAEAMLMNELQIVLGSRSPTVDDLAHLKYTEQIVLESMRLYPPAYMLSREAIGGFELGDYRLPGGTTVLISQWVTQRDSRFFERAEEFIPERWANDLVKRLPKCAYFPFGIGPRSCIGSAFAMMESILVLATIAQKFRFSRATNYQVEPWPSITLRPRYGIKVKVIKRVT